MSDNGLFTTVIQSPGIVVIIPTMFDRDQIEQFEKSQREQIVANGKVKLVRREIGLSILFCGIVVTVLYFVNRRAGSVLLASIGVLPIAVVGGYLHAIWKWQDITKRRS
jgi:hypothetical protein